MTLYSGNEFTPVYDNLMGSAMTCARLKTEAGCPWILDTGKGFYVQQIGSALHVMRPAKSGTHAETDCAFDVSRDGLSLATARVWYLAGETGRAMAARAVEKANEIFKESV